MSSPVPSWKGGGGACFLHVRGRKRRAVDVRVETSLLHGGEGGEEKNLRPGRKKENLHLVYVVGTPALLLERLPASTATPKVKKERGGGPIRI